MAVATNADHEILKINGDDLYGNFEKVLWFTERSIYNTLAIAKYLMSKRVNELDYKVVMTGEGSDELFGGYPAFRKDMYTYGVGISNAESENLKENLENSNDIFKGAMLANEEISNKSFKEFLGFTPSCLQPWLACETYAKSLVSSKYKEITETYDPGAAIFGELDLEQLENRYAIDQAQYVWMKTMLEGQILTWGGDRVDMSNSMEARPAFLDHHLAEAAVAVPPELRIKDNVEKYVLREAMSGLLPESLYKREKFPFMAPPSHADKDNLSSMQEIVNEFLSPERIREFGILDETEVNNLLNKFFSSELDASEKVQLDAIINHLLSVQILYKIFIIEDIPDKAQKMADNLGWKV